MKIILTEDVKNLGKKGDILETADGYARNYLIPKNLARIATQEAEEKNKIQKEEKIKKEKIELENIQKLASLIEGKEFIIKAKEKAGKLFGSIGAKEISLSLKKEGLEVKEKEIKIIEPIKELGEYKIEIELDHGIETYITVLVESES